MSKIIGITGGIASGKSTVVEQIRRAGYQVIDADQVVHDLQKKGGRLYQALILAFGTDIVAADGQLDRAKLAQLIFSNEENREKSAKLQNRIIREELARRRDALAAKEPLFFMDIPLLYELDYQDWFDEIWLIYTDEDKQLERLMKRNNYSSDEALKRITAQMPLKNKKKAAQIIIDNNGSPEETRKQLEVQLKRLEKGQPF
ncbi:dephospho-CoA kinase [Streptococcus devriesei]|uniref:dephospho-CoA kinase n=1 Tax=Streptococcus devriesei TaxID=231233 RepID=UPI0004125117|nr:dephospho-CoA kinase [Streptococcus devriesei]